MTYDFELTLAVVPGRGGSKRILNKNAKSMLMQLTKCYNFNNFPKVKTILTRHHR